MSILLFSDPLPAGANGQSGLLEVPAGAEVWFKVQAEDPDNEVVLAEIDFEGDRKFDQSQQVRGKTITAEFAHRYTSPGTYFPTARVTDSTASEGSR